MKRKWLCILFILAGIATIVGTILLSLGRFERTDMSPAWTLIYLSVAAIAAAVRLINKELVYGYKKVFLWALNIVSVLAILAGLAFMFYVGLIYTLIFIIIAITMAACFRYVNNEPDEPEVTKRKMAFLRAFRAVNILAILVCSVFVVLLLYMTYYYTDWKHNVLTLLALAVSGIVGAALSLKLRAPVFGRGISRAARCVPSAVALVGITALCIYSISFTNTLMFIIFVAITIAVWLWYDKREADEPDETEVTRRGMVFLRAFRAVGILTVLACFGVIVTMFFIKRNDYGLFWNFKNGLLLTALAGAGIAMAALSLELRAPISARGNARLARCVPIAVAVVMIAALCFVYLNYMPKYSLDEGINMVRSQQEFADKDIFYLTFPFSEDTTGEVTRDTTEPRTIDGRTYYGLSTTESFGGNPFYNKLYQYYCDSYSCDASGLHIMKGYILFNPATGQYEYTRAPDQDKTYGPEELPRFDYKFMSGVWPELNYNFMVDEDGQHDAVLNLFFRERWPYIKADGTYEEFFVDSGEWDAKMEDVMYPHNLSRNEAMSFLQSMDEGTLKTNLLEQINILGSDYKDKTIHLYFFGTEIGTYQDGEIVLK